MATPGISSSQATDTLNSSAAAPDTAAMESQGTDTDVEVVEVVDGKRRKLKSVVWKEFTRVQINGVWKARCD